MSFSFYFYLIGHEFKILTKTQNDSTRIDCPFSYIYTASQVSNTDIEPYLI